LRRIYALISFLLIGLAVMLSLMVGFYLVSIPVARDKIAIIDLRGELTGGEESLPYTTTGEIQRSFENARRDNKVKAVVLAVDSPGGEAAACYEMYSVVKRFEKPVVAFIKGTGASGAYLVSLGADRIVAHPFSKVGSIGVYIEFETPVPVEPENATQIYAISSGKLKDIWADGVLDENERKFLRMKVGEMKDAFFNLVFQRTGIKRSIMENLEENVENPLYVLVEGGWFGGEKAFELGLVENLGDLTDALQLAAELAGIKLEEARVVKIEPPPVGTYEDLFFETPLYQDNETLPIYLK